MIGFPTPPIFLTNSEADFAVLTILRKSIAFLLMTKSIVIENQHVIVVDTHTLLKTSRCLDHRNYRLRQT